MVRNVGLPLYLGQNVPVGGASISSNFMASFLLKRLLPGYRPHKSERAVVMWCVLKGCFFVHYAFLKVAEDWLGSIKVLISDARGLFVANK